MSKLKIKPVLHYLYAESILRDHHIDQILSEKTRYDRIRVLITLLKRLGPRTFAAFVESLKQSNQLDLSTRLSLL